MAVKFDTAACNLDMLPQMLARLNDYPYGLNILGILPYRYVGFDDGDIQLVAVMVVFRAEAPEEDK